MFGVDTMTTGNRLIPKIGQGDAEETNKYDVGDKPCHYYQADHDGNDTEAALWEYSLAEEKHRELDGRSTEHKDKGSREVRLLPSVVSTALCPCYVFSR